MILGIDPGFSGAIALLNPLTRELEVIDMPVLPGAKGRSRLDHATIANIMSPQPDTGADMAVMELVSAMPGQGVTSMFRFGQVYGALEMAIVGHGYMRYDVTPATWKKHFKLSRDKDVSRGMAMDRFPAYANKFTRKKDDGRAEAALIALYAFETLYKP